MKNVVKPAISGHVNGALHVTLNEESNLVFREFKDIQPFSDSKSLEVSKFGALCLEKRTSPIYAE